MTIVGFSQEKGINLEESILIATTNNKELLIKKMEVIKANKLIGSAFDISNTNFYYLNDETNLGIEGKPFETYGIEQRLLTNIEYYPPKY